MVKENIRCVPKYISAQYSNICGVTRRAYYHMQACGDNVYWWKNYNKKYGVFQQKRGKLC